MSDVYSYRRATQFRVYVYLGGLGAQPVVTHSDGESAERDAVERLRQHDGARTDRRLKPSSFAHIEYLQPDGPEQGKCGTYSRFSEIQRHLVLPYLDKAAPGGIQYRCECGAVRCSPQERDTHWQIAGTCTFCGGEEEVHPVTPGKAPDGDTWVPCPACGGTGDYVADPPPFDLNLFRTHYSLHKPQPFPADLD